MTKTLRPVLSPAVEAALDEPAPVAAGLEAAAEEVAAAEELEELELQAATATVAAIGSASASFLARLRVISLYPFNRYLRILLVSGRLVSGLGLCVGQPAQPAADRRAKYGGQEDAGEQ